MKIIYNSKIIPLKGFRCTNLFGILFVRGNFPLMNSTINHESIHTVQWKELLYIGFLLWYCIEWLIRFIGNGLKGHEAYRNLSFEKEAYANMNKPDYLTTRKPFCFVKYI